MTPERWNNIVGGIKEKFTVLEEGEFELEDMPGTCESIVFESPMGKMKLEFITKPVITDKKVITSRRIGASASVEYTYSDTEETHKFECYRWDEKLDDWKQVKEDGLF